jgi:hypothetical protein
MLFLRRNILFWNVHPHKLIDWGAVALCPARP